MSTAVLHLYEIVDQLAEVEAILEERGGELDDEIEARLDALSEDLTEKVERLCQWRANIAASAKAYQEEADRLAARAKTLTRTADSVKRYLHAQLERSGRVKLEAGTWRLAIQWNSAPSVVVSVDPESLPDRFRRVTVEADKKALLDADNKGETLPDGVIVTRGQHLRIR